MADDIIGGGNAQTEGTPQASEDAAPPVEEAPKSARTVYMFAKEYRGFHREDVVSPTMLPNVECLVVGDLAGTFEDFSRFETEEAKSHAGGNAKKVQKKKLYDVLMARGVIQEVA